MGNKIMSILSPILEVFTKEYREEAEYQEWAKKHIDYFKLNDNSEDINKKIERLRESV
jgi:hypothetical protein